MVTFMISNDWVRSQLNSLFEFIYDVDTGETVDVKLQNAWNEIIGMRCVFAAAVLQNHEEHACTEFDQIMQNLSRAITMIEMLYDQYVNERANGIDC